MDVVWLATVAAYPIIVLVVDLVVRVLAVIYIPILVYGTLVLPPTIDSKDIVIEVNTKLTEAEHCGEPFDDRSSTE